MRWLGIRVLVTWLILVVTILVAITLDHPPLTRVASLHLTECQLPCWIGITPGKTPLTAAGALIKRIFKDALSPDLGNSGIVSHTITVPSDKLRIDILLPSQVTQQTNDPIVQEIMISNLGTTDPTFTVTGIMSYIGSPSTIAYFSFSGGHYTEIYYDDIGVSLRIDKIRFGDCSPLTIGSPLSAFTIAVKLPKPDSSVIQKWRGFHTCYHLK